MVDGIDVTLEDLKQKLTDIKQKLSELRKKGYDTKIAELRLSAIVPKIKYLEVTREAKDVQKIKKLIDDTLSEIREIETGLTKRETMNPFEEVNILIGKAQASIKEKKLEDASNYYNRITKIYNILSMEEKKDALPRVNEIRLKL